MEPEEQDVPVVQETTEEVAEETTETPEETLTPEQIADLKRKADVSSQNFERAKKAEAKAKELEEKLKETVPSKQISTADVMALAKADVHDDDLERIEKFAKDEGVSIREALKNDELKAILAVRSEKRATATAANISNVRRGAVKVADEVLVSNASAGKLPTDDADIARLMAAKAKKR